jgi:hypothetical protein
MTQVHTQILLIMTDIITSHNIDLSFWNTLYIYFRKAIRIPVFSNYNVLNVCVKFSVQETS